jgi:hypothetical protein
MVGLCRRLMKGYCTVVFTAVEKIIHKGRECMGTVHIEFKAPDVVAIFLGPFGTVTLMSRFSNFITRTQI